MPHEWYSHLCRHPLSTSELGLHHHMWNRHILARCCRHTRKPRYSKVGCHSRLNEHAWTGQSARKGSVLCNCSLGSRQHRCSWSSRYPRPCHCWRKGCQGDRPGCWNQHRSWSDASSPCSLCTLSAYIQGSITSFPRRITLNTRRAHDLCRMQSTLQTVRTPATT